MQLNQIHRYKIAGYLLLPAAHSACTTQTKLEEGVNQRVSVCIQESHSRKESKIQISAIWGESKGHWSENNTRKTPLQFGRTGTRSVSSHTMLGGEKFVAAHGRTGYPHRHRLKFKVEVWY